MKKATKPKDLTKLKRAQEAERRAREAIRMVFNAAGVGDDYRETEPVHVAIEGVLVPRVRFLVEELQKTAART